MTEIDRHIAIAWLGLGHRGASPATVPVRIIVLKPVNSRANSTPASTLPSAHGLQTSSRH
jgi:hypothetical protein